MLLFFNLSILIMFSSGFLMNVTGFDVRSLFFDPFLFFISLYCLFLIIKKRFYPSALKEIYIYYLMFVLGAFFVFLWSRNDFYEKLLGFRNLVFYTSFWFFTFILYIKRNGEYRLLSNIQMLMLFFCAIGIFQSFYGGRLPDYLIKVANVGSFGFYDNPNAIRANGLIGNPLEFGGFALICFCVSYSRFLFDFRKKLNLIGVSICVAAVILSMSRTAIVVMILAGGLLHLLRGIREKKAGLQVLYLFFGACLGCLVILFFFNDSFVVKRFTSDADTNTVMSNKEHADDFEKSFDAIINNSSLGVGLGTQGVSSKSSAKSKIITDGAWFIYFLELGVPVCLFFFLFMYKIQLFLFKLIKFSEYTSCSLFCSSFAILFSMFLMSLSNSSFISPINMVVQWTITGLALSVAVKIKKINVGR